MKPKQGYNQKLYEENYDVIDFSKIRRSHANNKTNKQLSEEKKECNTYNKKN
jgi:hypothetical protein